MSKATNHPESPLLAAVQSEYPLRIKRPIINTKKSRASITKINMVHIPFGSDVSATLAMNEFNILYIIHENG